MCGINGFLNFQEPLRLIKLMNDTLAHRGPDASGEWIEGGLALGQRRLSIIDLSTAANQPFIKDNLVLVYNGEIYNFKELKQELIAQGVSFRTYSDTEVVLEIFRRYGPQGFDKLIGMFAFCIYNRSTAELFLARDYFGIKPLYYTFSGRQMAFSSELKALLRLPGLKKEINRQALVSCINYLWVPGDESIFSGIQKLPAAHYLKVNLKEDVLRPQIKPYWQLKIGKIDGGEDKIKDFLKIRLEESVKRHLVSDVPVGAFLSGGLDSSLIAVMAQKINPDISTYTISLSQKDKAFEAMPDDNIYAKKFAAKFGINHKDIPVEADILKNLPQMIYHLDEPIGDPAAINTYLICKSARENGIKVLLSGMGADEIFGGYRRHYASLLANRLNRLPAFVKNTVKAGLNVMPVRIGNQGLRQVRWAKRLFSFLDMPFDQAYMRSYSYYSRQELSDLFGGGYDSSIENMYDQHKEIFYRVEGLDDINRMCYTDIQMFMQGLNLTYTDRASMAASVEARVPFIDKPMIEAAMSIAGNYKINGKVSKYILKKTAEDYLPKEIIYRPKASFGMPIRAWISRDLRPMVDELLSKNQIRKRGFFDYNIIKGIIEDDRKGVEDNAYRIYQFLTLELWCRRFLDGQ